jgi:2'-5' RNA ligase
MNSINQQPLNLFGTPEIPYLYLLILELDEKIKHEITAIKTNFGKEFKSLHALNSIPHLTLCQFVSTLNLEEKMLNELESVSEKSNSFNLILNNFSGFRPHTIYIQIDNKPDFVELVKAIKTNVKIPIKTKYGKAGFSFTPHITIAKKLSKDQYELGLNKYSQNTYHADFIAKKMVLLRKPLDNSESYRIVKEFDLKTINHN